MARLYFEDRSPEYGAPIESDEDPLPSEAPVTTVEVGGAWDPIPGLDDGVRHVAFVDGVQRVDGHLTLDTPDTPLPTPGICAAFAVGASLWDREQERSSFGLVSVQHLAVFGGGLEAPMPPVAGVRYQVDSVSGRDGPALHAALQLRMRTAEGTVARELASADYLVIADGPINAQTPKHVVGYIKSHSRAYLRAPESGVIGRLKAGERTPLFEIRGTFTRYSWYVRLMDIPGGHSWSGIARLESPPGVSVSEARSLAASTAALLPLAAMPLHLDPRAPQNLIPIARLESELRHCLGDQALLRRELRTAIEAAENEGAYE